MRVAVLAYEGFNELDVFAHLHVLNRVARAWPEANLVAELVGATEQLRSMYGVQTNCQRPLAFVREADAVVIGSGGMLAAVEDPDFLTELRLDPSRQLIGAQCSGALLLARLGLVAPGQPVCTDARYRPHLLAAGAQVLDQPFYAQDNVATSGGCLASAYLSAWIIARLVGVPAAVRTLESVAPVGEEPSYVAHVLAALEPYLPGSAG